MAADRFLHNGGSRGRLRTCLHETCSVNKVPWTLTVVLIILFIFRYEVALVVGVMWGRWSKSQSVRCCWWDKLMCNGPATCTVWVVLKSSTCRWSKCVTTARLLSAREHYSLNIPHSDSVSISSVDKRTQLLRFHVSQWSSP